VRFHLVDIRDLDGEQLLATADLGDNLLAVLTRLGEQPGAVRRILGRIAAGSPDEREPALAELFILGRLRQLSGGLKREVEKMPGGVAAQPDRETIWPSPSRDQSADSRAVAAQLKRLALRLFDAQRIEDLFAR